MIIFLTLWGVFLSYNNFPLIYEVIRESNGQNTLQEVIQLVRQEVIIEKRPIETGKYSHIHKGVHPRGKSTHAQY